MRLRLYYLLLFGILGGRTSSYAEPLSFTVQAESAILINATTGKILYEKEAHVLQYPASITKIATALFALKNISEDQFDEFLTADSDSIVWISEEAKRRTNYEGYPAYWLEPRGTHMGIKKGEELSIRTLFYGLMLVSGNDAANMIAKHVSGTVPEFMNQTNAHLKEIGCLNTTFYNPHGLFHPKHQTTAYDMALMTKEALKNPFFCEVVSTVRYTRPKTNKQESSYLLQGNRLLRKGPHYYAKAIGGKTGGLVSASHASNTIVAIARDQDRTLIAVLLKSKDRNVMFQDAIKLFEGAFNESKVQRRLVKAGPQKFVLELPGAAQPVTTWVKNDVTIDYYPAEEPKIKCLLNWTVQKLPVVAGQQVGELILAGDGDVLIQKVPLLAQQTIEGSTSWKIQSLAAKTKHFKWQYILIMLGALIVTGVILKRRK